MSYYIKGNKERGAEVIKALEDKGGVNKFNCPGTNESVIYYIDKYDNIHCASATSTQAIITQFCDELTLPEKKWEAKFKLGDYYRSKSTSNIGKITGIDSDGFYIVHLLGYSPGGMENEENIEPWEPKRGETVLVRNSEGCCWVEAIYSFTDSEEHPKDVYCMVGGSYWNHCIPFDINKLGKITEEQK